MAAPRIRPLSGGKVVKLIGSLAARNNTRSASPEKDRNGQRQQTACRHFGNCDGTGPGDVWFRDRDSQRTYNGDPVSSGIYNQGLTIAKGIAPSDSGVILSTDFTNSIGKANQTINRSTDTGGADNDCDMNAITGVKTFDAAIFRANFVAAGSTLTMQIAFSSEEYLESVG